MFGNNSKHGIAFWFVGAMGSGESFLLILGWATFTR
jgi:hypothetical protein